MNEIIQPHLLYPKRNGLIFAEHCRSNDSIHMFQGPPQKGTRCDTTFELPIRIICLNMKFYVTY